MTVHQFFIRRSQIGEDMVVRLGDADARHIRAVLRLKRNATIRLVDDGQTVHSAVLEKVTVGEVCARIIGSRKTSLCPARLTVVQGIPRLTKTDLITQKLTELGAVGIAFVPMEYTPYTDAFERISKRHGRLQRIAEAAAKQCCRLDVPRVVVCADLDASLGELESGTMLFFADNMAASAQDPRKCLKGAGDDPRLAVFIGPEGGFSLKERETLTQRGAAPFSLGANILRTETAAIVAAAIILYELGAI